MKKYTNEPVSPEKIKFIHSVLNEPEVKEAWKRFIDLGQPYQSAPAKVYQERQRAFDAYCKARDAFLGLPPLKLIGVQQTHARYRR